jgi:hypothetical protein
MSQDPVAARSAFMADVQRKMLKAEEPPKPKKLTGTSDSKFARFVDETRECIEHGDWSLAKPMHLVALYAELHERVYRVAPAELDPKARTLAAVRARKLLDAQFGGDCGKFAEYARWCFNREKGRVEWRAREGREQTRISWGLFFNGALITDMRVALMAAQGKR